MLSALDKLEKWTEYEAWKEKQLCWQVIKTIDTEELGSIEYSVINFNDFFKWELS